MDSLIRKNDKDTEIKYLWKELPILKYGVFPLAFIFLSLAILELPFYVYIALISYTILLIYSITHKAISVDVSLILIIVSYIWIFFTLNPAISLAGRIGQVFGPIVFYIMGKHFSRAYHYEDKDFILLFLIIAFALAIGNYIYVFFDVRENGIINLNRLLFDEIRDDSERRVTHRIVDLVLSLSGIGLLFIKTNNNIQRKCILVMIKK